MKFIHFADCHIDGYRDAKLAALGFQNFIHVIDKAISEQVDFVLLAGDLFNTALPRVDALKQTTEQLKRLKEASIPVYLIPGSHDYSPHGKTMLDVLEIAELCINVMKGSIVDGNLQLKFTIDPKTNAHITGIPGKRGMLDKHYYTTLDTAHLENTTAPFKVFMFHTTLSELKPKNMEASDSTSLTFLPKGFDYYAGGHVHIRKRFSNEKYKNIVYPGPTFPNSFSELEELSSGTYILYDTAVVQEDGSFYKHITIPNKEVIPLHIVADNKTASEVEQEIIDLFKTKSIKDTILLLRIEGCLAEGKAQDINFKDIVKLAYTQGAFSILRNTSKLTSVQFEEVHVQEESIEAIEQAAITEHAGQIPLTKDLDEKQSIRLLMDALSVEQYDGEKKAIFTERITQAAKTILER